MSTTQPTCPIKSTLTDAINDFLIPEIANVSDIDEHLLDIEYEVDSCRLRPTNVNDEDIGDFVTELTEETLIRESHRVFIVSETTTEPLTQLLFYNYFDPLTYGHELTYMQYIEVAKSIRRNGIGTKLRTLGISALSDHPKAILSFPTRPGGRRLNEKHGFETLEHPDQETNLPIYIYYTDPDLDIQNGPGLSIANKHRNGPS